MNPPVLGPYFEKPLFKVNWGVVDEYGPPPFSGTVFAVIGIARVT